VERYSRLLLIATPVVIVFFSLWQGAYDIDPHHWGLMLSNAKDLYEGLIPYKDIFIQYGILTTILQALAFGIGKNMLSIIVITSICYAIGILLVYVIALKVLESKTTALYVLITLVLFHPLAMYPWSNYIAFPFLMYGIYLSLETNSNEGINCLRFVGSGVFLGLALLSREGLAPAAILFIVISLFFDLRSKGNKKNIFVNFTYTCCGFALPLGIFFTYLLYNGLIEYWVNLAITLPGIYAQESFGSLKTFVFKALFREIYTGYRHADIRWILVSFVILANLYICASFLYRQKKTNPSTALAKISLASLLLLSSALHLSEIFRIATASSIGLVGLYSYLESRSRAKIFFVIMAIWLGLTATYGNRGNYFFPTWDAFKEGVVVETPEIFVGQLWTPSAIGYYQSIDKALERLKSMPCGIQFQKNNTRDSLLQVMSPFKQLQLAPFQTSEQMSSLRPDLDANKRISMAQDIILLESVSISSEIIPTPPAGFSLYAKLPIPQQFFMPHNQQLMIYAPSVCLKYHQ